MQVVIGLVGEKGGGKGTLTKLLREDAPPGVTVATMRFSDLHRETLALWHLPITRQNMQELSRILVAAYGKDVIANAMRVRIETTAAQLVVVDGVRWEDDRLLIRSFPRNLLVYVTADARVRFERIQGRGENHDDHTASFEQFMDEERALAEQSIAHIGATADVTISNEGGMEDMRAHAKRILDRAQPGARA